MKWNPKDVAYKIDSEGGIDYFFGSYYTPSMEDGWPKEIVDAATEFRRARDELERLLAEYDMLL